MEAFWLRSFQTVSWGQLFPATTESTYRAEERSQELLEISKWRIHRPNSIPILEMRQVCPPEGKMYSNTQPVGASPRPDFLNHICVFMCFVFGYFFFLHCACVLRHFIMSDSLRPYGLQSTRLLCPWNSPGRILGRVAMPSSSYFILTSPLIRNCNCHAEYVGFMEHRQNAFVFLSTALKTQ